MQNQSSTSYFNRILSQTPQSNERKQHRKNSQKTNLPRQRKQSIHQLEGNMIRGRDSQDQNLSTKKKLSNQQQAADSLRNKPKQLSTKQQQEVRQRMQQEERRDYLATKITPVMNKMLVKIVNQKPHNVLDFMVKFLKNQQGQFQEKRFNTKAFNDTIDRNKNMQEVFDQTVTAKFLKFKK